MSYEIVKSIVIKKDRVFSRMDSNNVYPKDFISMENPGLTRIYNEKGLMGLYVSLVEGGLSGYLHFQKGGNKLVKQLERITDSLFEDKQYRNMKNEADKLEYKLWDFKEENEEKKQCKQEYDKYSEKLHNYVDLKVREFFNPKLKVPDSIKRELDNVLEMYEENLDVQVQAWRKSVSPKLGREINYFAMTNRLFDLNELYTSSEIKYTTISPDLIKSKNNFETEKIYMMFEPSEVDRLVTDLIEELSND